MHLDQQFYKKMKTQIHFCSLPKYYERQVPIQFIEGREVRKGFQNTTPYSLSSAGGPGLAMIKFLCLHCAVCPSLYLRLYSYLLILFFLLYLNFVL